MTSVEEKLHFWINSQKLVKIYIACDFEKLLAKYELPENKFGN